MRDALETPLKIREGFSVAGRLLVYLPQESHIGISQRIEDETERAVLREKLIRRGVPVKNLVEDDAETATLGRARQTVSLKQGIDQETAKRISKDIRDAGLKKVQVQIQGEELRVTSPSRDTLQEAIALVKGGDYGVELSFGNFR